MAGPNGSSRIAETSRVGPSFELLHGRPPRRVGGLPLVAPCCVRPPRHGSSAHPCSGNSYACSRARVHRQNHLASRSATVAPVIGAAAPVTGSKKCRPRVAKYMERMARCRASAQSQPPRRVGGPRLPPAALRPAATPRLVRLLACGPPSGRRPSSPLVANQFGPNIVPKRTFQRHGGLVVIGRARRMCAMAF